MKLLRSTKDKNGENMPHLERSVSACCFKIAIFPFHFSNVKWIWIPLESLKIELNLCIKIYLDYFPGRLK